jgi:hypothetical protein
MHEFASPVQLEQVTSQGVHIPLLLKKPTPHDCKHEPSKKTLSVLQVRQFESVPSQVAQFVEQLKQLAFSALNIPSGQLSTHCELSKNSLIKHDEQFEVLPPHVKQVASHFTHILETFMYPSSQDV